MPAGTWILVLIVGYVLTYIAALIGGISFVRWRRKTKWPFKESDKLLRGPGEGLRRKLSELDETLMREFIGSLFVALFCWPLFEFLARRVGLSGRGFWLGGLLGLVLVAGAGAWRCVRLWQKRSDYYLGWFGERLVAEKLRPLQLQGYRVFHDVPGEPGKNGFNIDHVVVGPTGVTVVEVKTRRKGDARPGLKDYEIIFDGSKLILPQSDDRHGIQQAINEADWLRKWIFECVGLKVGVKAVLTLPGWFVRESPSPALRVVNPDFLTSAISGRGEVTLETREIDLIARQLDLRCRDVEE